MKNILHLPLLNSKQLSSVLSKILPRWMIQLQWRPVCWLAHWSSRHSFIQVCKRKQNLWSYEAQIYFLHLWWSSRRRDMCRAEYHGSRDLGERKQLEPPVVHPAVCVTYLPLEWSAYPFLTMVPMHCNYLQWSDSCWERGQQKNR